MKTYIKNFISFLFSYAIVKPLKYSDKVMLSVYDKTYVDAIFVLALICYVIFK